MKTVSIEFSIEEADALLSYIDLALKSKGLEIGENAVVLAKKIQNAFIVKQEPELTSKK